jgi:hypothetical protein
MYFSKRDNDDASLHSKLVSAKLVVHYFIGGLEMESECCSRANQNQEP